MAGVMVLVTVIVAGPVGKEVAWIGGNPGLEAICCFVAADDDEGDFFIPVVVVTLTVVSAFVNGAFAFSVVT